MLPRLRPPLQGTPFPFNLRPTYHFIRPAWIYVVTAVQETCSVTLCANTLSQRLVSENAKTSAARYLLNNFSAVFFVLINPLKVNKHVLITWICGWTTLQLSKRSLIYKRLKDSSPPPKLKLNLCCFFEFLKGLASGSIKTTSRSIGHAKTNLFHLLYSS